MKSYFISGSDTNVGKTYVAAGLAAALKKINVDVGIMKPLAAGTAQKSGYKSEDVQLLASAAQVSDSEELLNPYFSPIPASPYTATQNLGLEVDINNVLNCYKKLSSIHEIMLVEGMGGIMTPILQNYFVTNLIKDLDLETIIVCSSRIGTVNHTLMTNEMCKNFGIKVRGFIINNLDTFGYPLDELKRDLEDLTKIPVLCSVPFIEDFTIEQIAHIISDQIDLKSLIQ